MEVVEIFCEENEFYKIEGEKRNTNVCHVHVSVHFFSVHIFHIAKFTGEFCYVKNKQYNDIIYLKCKDYQMCDGTAKINVSGEVLESMRAHICGIRAEHFGHLSALESMKSLAATTQQSLRQIYNNIIQTCPDVVNRTLTYLKSEQILPNARRSNNSKNPESLNDAVHLKTQSNTFSNIFHGYVGFEEQLAFIFGSQALTNNSQGTFDLS